MNRPIEYRVDWTSTAPGDQPPASSSDDLFAALFADGFAGVVFNPTHRDDATSDTPRHYKDAADAR
ncbi:hypothetical protein WKR88_20120 [Trinickia caryophylli]|uniref:hypothetical protein n=1 Tax=Trinickia caryophylli TaxID=28094 RepID=UPI00111BD4E6|nr:hypothetical protein [Trinickia caryophylli]TRX14113.1 hypothetical protein FNF07_22555 [Trinickia caryophylli]WQE13931.1 hypothetical protein U0034_24760 [Trinickia caryophylli]